MGDYSNLDNNIVPSDLEVIALIALIAVIALDVSDSYRINGTTSLSGSILSPHILIVLTFYSILNDTKVS